MKATNPKVQYKTIIPTAKNTTRNKAPLFELPLIALSRVKLPQARMAVQKKGTTTPSHAKKNKYKEFVESWLAKTGSAASTAFADHTTAHKMIMKIAAGIFIF